jgi:hypothetical protein
MLRAFRIGYVISLISCLAHGLIYADLSRVEKLSEHYESGAHEAELASIAAAVQAQFSTRAAHDQQVVIFDIDDVAFCCYPFYKNVVEQGYVWEEFLQRSDSLDSYHDFLHHVQLPAFTSMLQLYQHFVSLGYKIIFLTSRKYDVYDLTVQNLHVAGYIGFERLIMRSEEDVKIRGGRFKERARTALVQEGYDIVCTIDDAEANLQGAHVGLAVKIPNYLF